MGKTGSFSDVWGQAHYILIKYSADGCGYVSSLWFCLTPNYGRINGGNGILLQKKSCLLAMAPKTDVFSAPDPNAGHCQPTPLLEIPEH